MNMKVVEKLARQSTRYIIVKISEYFFKYLIKKIKKTYQNRQQTKIINNVCSEEMPEIRTIEINIVLRKMSHKTSDKTKLRTKC